MNQEQAQALQLLNCSVQGQSIAGLTSASNTASLNSQYTVGSAQTNAVYSYDSSGGTLWQYWQNQYYPYVIRESYPVYIQERAMDKGKQAFEILKALMDKGLVKVDKVKDFIEAMDILLKTL